MAVDVSLTLDLAPEQVAHAFWGLDSGQMVAFFAELERIAGYNLCLQMAHVVADMSEPGNSDAQAGFRTMFAHADDYPEAAAEWRAIRGKSEIARFAGTRQ